MDGTTRISNVILFPRYYFIVTNSRLAASKVVKVYNGRGDKEGKNTLRWDKTSCHRFGANKARLKMGFLAYNLLHLIRRFYLLGEDTRRSIEWVITRLVKAGARITYQARYCHVHVTSAFPLKHHYRAVLGWQHGACTENGLQRSDRRGIVKIHEKVVQAWLGVISKAFWVVPVRFPALNKGKSIKNLQARGKAFWERLPHNS